ncbi:MAG: sensor histidine kinase [Spirochaetota bacterium]
MRLSLQTRLVVLHTVTMAVLLISFFVFVYLNFSHAMFSSDIHDRFDEKLVQYAQGVAAELSRRHGPFYADIETYRADFDRLVNYDFFLRPSYGQVRDFPSSPSDTPILLIRNGPLGTHFIPVGRETIDGLKRGEYVLETTHDIFAFPIRVAAIRFHDVDGQPYLLQIGMTMREIQTTFNTVLARSLLVGPLLLAIISLAGYVFVRRSLHPVREIVKIARRITAEDLSLRLRPTSGRDAVAELIDTLNDMIARLERSFTQAKQFTDDVSHELRTPLTIMKGEIEVAMRQARSGDEYRSTLGSVLEEVEKLERIVADLLFLSRMDAGRINPRFKRIDLDGVLLETCEETGLLAREKSIAMQFGAFVPVVVNGDEGLLKRLFFNILANAVQHTAPGGEVTISCIEAPDSPGTALVAISDNGPGIPAESITRIFDRFYRVDTSRSHATGGVGLGLAIVRKVIELHGGEIRVESEPGKGTVFFIYLPETHNN